LTWLRLRISYLRQAFFLEVRLECALLRQAYFPVGFFGGDRVEQETESELSHWSESGGALECCRRSNQRFHVLEPAPEALEARKIPGDKLFCRFPLRRRRLRPEWPIEPPGE
jgi:hypothetical protein